MDVGRDSRDQPRPDSTVDALSAQSTPPAPRSSTGPTVPHRRTAQPNCRAPQRAPPSRIVARRSPIAALL
ncbi:hypothetical protein PJP10_29355, partial [Mycobacterium kansasii]